MTSLLRVEFLGAHRLHLWFSDGTDGVFDAGNLLQRSGSLLVKLRDPAYFAQCFVEAGALCWPNGLELSPQMLQAAVREQGSLHGSVGAA